MCVLNTNTITRQKAKPHEWMNEAMKTKAQSK